MWTNKAFFLNLVKTLHSGIQPINLQCSIIAGGKLSPHRYSHSKGNTPIHYLVGDTLWSSRSFQKRRCFLTAKSSFLEKSLSLQMLIWCTSPLMGGLSTTKDIWFLFAPKWSFLASQFSPRRWLYYCLIYICTHWELVPGPAFRSYYAAGEVIWQFLDQLRASQGALLPCSVQRMHAKHIMLIKTYCTSGCLHLDVFISF